MRVAVLSDVHGNLEALESVLADAAETADEIWCLGDIVGYGSRPNECVALVRARCARVLAGNHDLAVIGTVDVAQFSEDAARSVRWTREVLRPESEQYLGGLHAAEPAGSIGLFHGSPRDPIWEYVMDAQAARAAIETADRPLILCGHTHVAVAAYLEGGRLRGDQAPDGSTLDLAAGGRWLLNPGSVGQPRDQDPRAAFVLLDLLDDVPRRATFRRVAYDVARAQEGIREAGLPDRLADRLSYGL